ncbi:hypothetical protein SLA2020_529110 [Shorea laevis]
MWIWSSNGCFAGLGAVYETTKSGVGMASMGVMKLELVMKSIVPIVMAGVLGIYGLIIAIIICAGINPEAKSYFLFDGYAHLFFGLACGLIGLSVGMAIRIVGDVGVRYLSSFIICFLAFPLHLFMALLFMCFDCFPMIILYGLNLANG